MQSTAPEHITIARIIKPQGNRGEVAAEILTDFPQRFSLLREVELRMEGHSPLRLTLEAHWFHKNRIILKFQGIDSISQAGILKGYELTLPSQERLPLPEGCYYHFDLVGCCAKDLHGQALGEVLEVLNMGGNLLLKISSQRGELLVPFARDILKEINLETKELVCDLPEGLMDL